MDYSVNMLIQWQNDQGKWEDDTGKKLIERVLWINNVATLLITIDIDPANTVAWPRIRKKSELDRSFEEGRRASPRKTLSSSCTVWKKISRKSIVHDEIRQ